MARELSNGKRKTPDVEADKSEDDGFDAVLDGVLSQSEDDFESDDASSDADGDLEGDLEGTAKESNGDQGEGDGELDIDGIPPGADEVERPAGDGDHDDSGDDKPNYRVTTDANGGVRFEYDEIDAVYDSDDTDAQEVENTIGNIPLSFYDAYPHIGYSINGHKLWRPATTAALDSLLDSVEVPEGWTGLTDPATGKPLNLTKEELELLRRVQQNEVPEDGYDPYPDTVEYFTSIQEKMPLSAAPEPKRRFVPSKHEAKKIMRLVRAIRDGKILPYKPPEEREKEEDEKDQIHYDIWQDEQPREPHVMHIPAPKLPYPGYDMSYNPPPEYVPSKAEREAWESAEPEEREKDYLPHKYDSLRKVPGYDMFVKERFERCLDLYLAPRVRKARLRIDPDALLPKLPPAEDLRPFPTVCQTIFRGHVGWVRSLAVDPSGCWLASGGDDGTVRVWELLSGRQVWVAKLSSDEVVAAVRWRPTRDGFVLGAAAGEDVFLIVPPVVDPELEQTSRDLLAAGFGAAANGASKPAGPSTKQPPAKWARPGARLEDQGVLLQVTVRSPVKSISWHRRGDHFCTVSPSGGNGSVAMHTLSRHVTQVPFRKISNLPRVAHFHPQRPLFFLATNQAIRCYDLQKMELSKTIQPGARMISSFDVHPGGDHLVVGSYDRRLLWHDLDLSNRPFKTMRFHDKAIRAVRYHATLPLFADASDDGSLQIFHARVYNDLMENPTIVPLKMLRGHRVAEQVGVLDLDWHPKEPWCVSAGADGTCRLWC